MNELPREAKAMLALAKDAHDPPDPRARERVRGKVLAAVTVVPVGLSVGAAQLGKPSAGLFKTWFGSKTALAGALIALGAVGSMTVMRARPDAARPAPAVAPPASLPEPASAGLPTPVVTPAASTQLEPEALPARVRSVRAAAASAPTPVPSLHAELNLLANATQQLEQGDTQAALRSLAEHRRRFARSQLRPEREGLEVLAHCQQKRAQAQKAARAYLARTPTAVLIARIEQACGL